MVEIGALQQGLTFVAEQKPAAALDAGERLTYQGSVPGNYVVEEPVRQWAPRMQRITTLGVDPELASYSLPQLKWETLQSTDAHAITAMLKQQLPADWQNSSWTIHPSTQPTHWNSLSVDGPNKSRLAEVLVTVAQLIGDVKAIPTIPGMLIDRRGVFSLLTELSPTAAPDCEDLILTSRPTLVLVNEVEPGRYLVLRVVFAPNSQ